MLFNINNLEDLAFYTDDIPSKHWTIINKKNKRWLSISIHDKQTVIFTFSIKKSYANNMLKNKYGYRQTNFLTFLRQAKRLIPKQNFENINYFINKLGA